MGFYLEVIEGESVDGYGGDERCVSGVFVFTSSESA